ncbi:hypothetical protein STIAU_8447, partial [Stigmatella aurantiaca DW4/3-1]
MQQTHPVPPLLGRPVQPPSPWSPGPRTRRAPAYSLGLTWRFSPVFSGCSARTHRRGWGGGAQHEAAKTSPSRVRQGRCRPMGWLVWMGETWMALGASWLVAAALYPDKGVLHRLIVTLLVLPALILTAMQALGIPGLLRPLWLGVLAPGVFAVPGWLAWRRLGRAQALALLRSDVSAPARLVREAWRDREPAALTVPVATAVLLLACVLVWIFKSWTWDPVWYHVPITAYAIQTGSLDWIDTSVPWTQSHPKNVELLAAWNCLFPLDNRLDDSSQLPFALLGAAVTAAWARAMGARPAFAAGAGAAWVLLPPIFLQVWSTHVDVACGALLSATVFFMRERPTARDRWMNLLALGLYAGTKMTGAFHLLMLGPWIAVRTVLELREGPGGRGTAAGQRGALGAPAGEPER